MVTHDEREQIKQIIQESGVRVFPGGATRDLTDGKPDYHRFLCVQVLSYYVEKYMQPHQMTAAGLREPDNHKNGFGVDVLMASLTRHFWSVWKKWDNQYYENEKLDNEAVLQDLCGVMFNTMAMMREILNEKE